MSQIHVIHENPAWMPPFAEAFARRGLPWREWVLDRGVFDLSAPPPEGVWYSRMSASAHTRDHRYAPELAAAVLAWLERHGRRVVNGGRALDLEISKVRQYAALEAAGIAVPRTVLAAGKPEVVEAARHHFPDQPIVLKPNRGGKGLGVRLFQGPEALAAWLDGPGYEAPVDGLHLLQRYARAVRPVITRAEFVGGRFLYAVEVDTSDGFELCPAEACEVGTACPADARAAGPKFQILPGIDQGLQARMEQFLAANGIEVAGIEFVTEADGSVWTYDVNTNTNYNPDAERRAGIAGTGRSGPGALAKFLGAELAKLGRAAA